MWVESVVGSRGFLFRFSGFPPLSKTSIPNSFYDQTRGRNLSYLGSISSLYIVSPTICEALRLAIIIINSANSVQSYDRNSYFQRHE